ncbi:hypothetical protein [Scandinavium hiltneri]|uniref:hypothetical protein n=1 Tax=Scandinavium hiltneri TaxID=2926519 RepID=UPI002869831D|nr:hypothetical protein [Scandinavium hiltneri]
MDVRNFSNCEVMTKSPSWGVMDLIWWKIIPTRFGGGIPYSRRFKDSWVVHNKSLIRSAALKYRLPIELIAGVCWIEVGGDPNIVDRIGFEIRAYDWSGPVYIDNNWTITLQPQKTSFGFVSMQLRTAAKTMGLDVAKMDISQLRRLAAVLRRMRTT